MGARALREHFPWQKAGPKRADVRLAGAWRGFNNIGSAEGRPVLNSLEMALQIRDS